MESDPSLLYQDSDAWNKFHSRHSSGKVFKIFMLSALPLHRMPTAIAACFSVLKPGGLLLFRDYVFGTMIFNKPSGHAYFKFLDSIKNWIYVTTALSTSRLQRSLQR
ncbi:uncharacterized protein LOC114260964 isoform X3 [Camellia sinensis]|nr:uncharacterized protein LOC114260964 isoform X3 [Camellia sinensis]XP_028056999.1 uncharacterized protein LOC114260964 isoform X3 [Camellia sinensis]